MCTLVRAIEVLSFAALKKNAMSTIETRCGFGEILLDPIRVYYPAIATFIVGTVRAYPIAKFQPVVILMAMGNTITELEIPVVSLLTTTPVMMVLLLVVTVLVLTT